ncbi:MAG TPA: O-methyltransferase [Williamwhitmania sp.]|jgi:caffeoyl-CoA O-methyltransferase|nr:O-methyltransferase [Williamwhitmania sp.]
MIPRDRKLEQYILEHTQPEEELLKELDRNTNLNTVHPRMLSGHLQGVVLEMISKMVFPAAILEIGTFTGYSALCLAKGLSANGVLHTIEIDDELAPLAQSYFDRASYGKQIKLHIGNAIDIIPTLITQFDLAFIDGDKRQYIEYFKAIMPFMKIGSFILADNVLWDGKVVSSVASSDAQTKGILNFNDFVHNDSSVENVLLPIRDGIMLLRKVR